jgi:hypothetical protein
LNYGPIKVPAHDGARPILPFDSLPQRNSVTHQSHSTVHVAAPFGVIDAIAVADIEPIPGAVLPDRVLDEPGKGLRKRWIELPGVDPLGHGLNDVGAAAGPVAGRSIQMFRVETDEEARSRMNRNRE